MILGFILMSICILWAVGSWVYWMDRTRQAEAALVDSVTVNRAKLQEIEDQAAEMLAELTSSVSAGTGHVDKVWLQ